MKNNVENNVPQTPIGVCEAPDEELLFGRALRRRIFRAAYYKDTFVEEIANIDTGGKTLKNKARSGGLIIEKLIRFCEIYFSTFAIYLDLIDKEFSFTPKPEKKI